MRYAILLLFLPALALAGGGDGDVVVKKFNNPTWDNSVDQAQDQSQNQAQDVAVNVAGDAGDTTNVENTTAFNSENNSSNVVLVPNNNTESCMRVYGLAFGNKDGSGGIGWPYRSRECDLEAAADDAFAQGNLELGWMMKCKQKSMKKAFGGRDWKATGEQACLESALGKVRMAERIEQLEHQRNAVIDECEHQKAVRDEANARCNQRYLEALGEK